MDVLAISRWQFAIVTVYHFFFVPITLGMSISIAIMETIYVKTGNENYRKMAKFWGKLFLINFAIGVATGIVQEFQFGMNWSEYSRFMGDIFGAPLAIEALLAFYMESTFIGIWIFGWNKFSPKGHAALAWLVALGSNLSAIWILTANSFMQEPVGYALANGRAEMVDFFALIANHHLWYQFPHVFFSGITQAGFFIMGISAWHMLKKTKNIEPFKISMRFGAKAGLIGIIFVVFIGHFQGQHLTAHQPMKMAAAEALWETENPASMSLFAIPDQANLKNSFNITLPNILSFLNYNKFKGEVKGINNVQKEYEKKYGPGDYIPNVLGSYWTFRIMVGVGFLMLLIAFIVYMKTRKENFECKPFNLKIIFYSIFLPTIGISTGWIFTEIARQPWIVFGLMKTEQGISKAVSVGEALTTLIGFTVLYAILIVFTVQLWKKYAKKDMDEDYEPINPSEA
ncbi:MAG: cytochrome ubiquinol oxidase subunit I [Chlorobi bacterium]|nr:cytochrome ubiquinol oxidase subunit I [Chlorobiota bacterium]